MNTAISRLFAVVVLLFTVLVMATSWSTVFGADGLDKNPKNRRGLIRDARVPRGLIRAADGTVLARNRRRGTPGNRFYTRIYPTGPLFSHAIGYSFIQFGQSGLEKSRDEALAGKEEEFQSILSELESHKREGKDVVTTLDPKAQQTAVQALGGRAGSIVAVEPSTGRVRVMVSIPDFDPNQVPKRKRQLDTAPGSPVLNRATQARYPPGSTFKVVTAAAALDSGKFTPQSVLSGKSPQTIGGVPLSNFGNEQFGSVSLTDALTHSVNTVWGQVGERLGKGTMYKYMERFGFDRKPPLDYPPDQMDASGVFAKGRLLSAGSPVDIGRVAIGQERLQVTPLQMAMVAAAIGNGGNLMKPRLTDRIVAKDGRVTDRIEPDRADRVMSKKAAGELGQMMGHVVEEGTGTAGALSGIKVAGKTGTAEVQGGAANQAWFISFAPIDKPRMAIAVTVERTSGQGGTEAAPLAKQVLEVLFHEK
jgi:penicillin-binding protein A